MPCIRRFLCELEVAARTSENYIPKEPELVNDRNPDEEAAPEEVDPISEMQVEAIRALYRSVHLATGSGPVQVGSPCNRFGPCTGRFTLQQVRPLYRSVHLTTGFLTYKMEISSEARDR